MRSFQAQTNESIVLSAHTSIRVIIPRLVNAALLAALFWLLMEGVVFAMVSLFAQPHLATSAIPVESLSATIHIKPFAQWGFAALLALGILGHLGRALGTRLTLTNQRLLLQQGLLARRMDEIDLRTISDTSSTQSVLHRLLGIGTVRVHSNDRTHPLLTLPGLRKPHQLREALRRQVYHKAQR